MGILDIANEKGNDEENLKKIVPILLAFILPISLAYFMMKEIIKKDGFIVQIYTKKQRFYAFIWTLIVSVALSTLFYYIIMNQHWIYFIYFLVPIFVISLSFFFLTAESIFKSEISFQLKPSHLIKNITDFKKNEEGLLNKLQSPIGISLTTLKPVFLEVNRRHEHLIITGASGLGKTSLALSLLRHDFISSRPAIFVDPKGDREDINAIIHYAKIYNRAKDLYIFSLAEENNFFYDPLALGKSESKVDKLIQTLTFENDYYKSVAENILSIIFTIYEYKAERITLNLLEGLLLSKERLQSLLDEVPDFLQSISDLGEKQSLMDKVNRFKSIKNDEIMGIQSKISRLNNKELKDKINPNTNKTEINVIDVIENNKILVFDIKAGEFSSLSKLIGRMLLKDLEIAASLLQDKKIKLNAEFIPVYFDEFDSFATENFHEFIKTARSGKMGLTLMFQSVAGIKQINEFLTDHATTNSVTSIHFRVNSELDLNYVANLCGTEERKQNSNQIDQKNILGKITGMGTEFITENFKVSPNLIRSLNYGQCIVYKKGINQIDLVQSWHGKKELKNSKTITELKNLNKKLIVKNKPNNKKYYSKIDARLMHLKPTERFIKLSFIESERIRELEQSH